MREPFRKVLGTGVALLAVLIGGCALLLDIDNDYHPVGGGAAPVCTGLLGLPGPPQLPAGRDANSLTAADLNGDGKIDLAVSSSTDNTMSVMLGLGNGTFDTAMKFQAGIKPLLGEAADLDEDGRPDLAYTNLDSNSVSVMHNNGNGAFASSTSHPAGSKPFAVIAADLNNDGKNDLVATNSAGANISVLLNKGGGELDAADNYSFTMENPPPDSVDVAAADLNGDGFPDLAVAHYGKPYISVLLNQGAGTFDPAAAKDYTVGDAAERLVAADMDGDGKQDIAVANYNSTCVSVLFNKGLDPSSQIIFEHKCFELGNLGSYSIAAGDLNADGNNDLVVASYPDGIVKVLQIQGNGDFAVTASYATGVNPRRIKMADLNGDSKPDMAIVNETSENVSVLLGRGDGTFVAAAQYAVSTTPRSVATAYLNLDDKPDLVVVNKDANNVGVLLNQGDGTFGAAIPYGTGAGPSSVATADMNADGSPDLAVTNYNDNTVSVLINQGNGTFVAGTVPCTTSPGSGPSSVAAADMNADGNPDLATANDGSNSVSVLLGKGDGTCEPAVDYALGMNGSTGASSVTTADFNADGKPDLAVTDRKANLVRVLLNKGDGTFSIDDKYPTGLAPSSITAADLNADGKPDLAIANYNDGTVTVLHNLGNGKFVVVDKGNHAAHAKPTSTAAVDLNGDGKLDLAVTNEGSNDVSALLNLGDGTFDAPISYIAGAGPSSVAAADLNADGRPDLAIANATTSSVSVLLNTCLP